MKIVYSLYENIWTRLETLECASIKVSGSNPPGANFCVLVHNSFKWSPTNGKVRLVPSD